ncbi:adenylate/guanylate cyclase domain-containing protein [Vibrio anguillarum]|uniref:adenylate/guanylate cyclase domain-containing protein n=1 Tax=Vibrio anguillarum TaxID=55601 RepID=UPI00188A2AD7|nr:adenylate/guanylate cyclase domain-containing protein [Vibrio anguillarum]MBF4337505.1 adenylate/guanylate cyclase domain-containing protein [Vibrio anguillarum]
MSAKSLEEITKGYFSDIRDGLESKRSKRIIGNENFSTESFDELFESVDLYKSASVSRRLKAESSGELTAPEEYTYQNALRPWFNKVGLNQSKVGPHPDFAHLKDSGEVEFHHIVTMFVDIKRSSRLSLLMPLQDAYVVKNRILQACVDVIRALDGYPHRLMGDAVMAFFGGKGNCPEDAIANALNASSALKLILTETVFPELNKLIGKDVNLGVRVGLDYGSRKEVVWANYGYGDASEVTALGIPVDLASKAQSQARTNTAMLGQGILDYVDFPDRYSEIKTVGKNKSEERYILPNMSDENGIPINRRCRLLKMEMYQDLLPVPLNWKTLGSSRLTYRDNIKFKCYYRKSDSDGWEEYKSVSYFLEKDMKLKFVLEILNPNELSSLYPLNAKFIKNNHGKEALQNEENGLTDTKVRQIDKPTDMYQSSIVLDFPEGTAYRGLHTMEVSLSPKSNLNVVIYSDIIGVFIK